MSDRIGFPRPAATAEGPSEDRLIIQLFSGGVFHKGGEASYASIAEWRTTADREASPFVGIVLEFVGNAEFTIGSGATAQAIGLFGEITGIGKFLLGIVGINFASTLVPQIPLVQNAALANIGFSQIIADVAVYDKLSIGGVFGNIDFSESGTVTVKVRPIRDRFYQG